MAASIPGPIRRRREATKTYNGSEVWSAMEGQQRFDNHVDKLLNYIRYWQASGENIKISLRIKTRMEPLTQEKQFTGGGMPYGYRIEKRGRTNKRNVEVNDMVIDPEAAQIVKLIFNKYVNEGYGAQLLSRSQMEKIKGKQGENIVTAVALRPRSIGTMNWIYSSM